jgi:hypothetical protein
MEFSNLIELQNFGPVMQCNHYSCKHDIAAYYKWYLISEMYAYFCILFLKSRLKLLNSSAILVLL